MKLGAIVAITALAFAFAPAAFASSPGHGAHHGHHGHGQQHHAGCTCNACGGHGLVYFNYYSGHGVHFGLSAQRGYDDCRPRVVYRPHRQHRAYHGFRYRPSNRHVRTPYRGSTWRYRYGHQSGRRHCR